MALAAAIAAGAHAHGAGQTPHQVVKSVVMRLDAPAVAEVWLDKSLRRVHITVRAPKLGPVASSEPVWEGWVLSNDIRDTFSAAGLEPIASSLVLREPDGSRISVGSWSSPPHRGHYASSVKPVIQRIRARAAALGMTVASLRVFDGYRPAPDVLLTAHHPLRGADCTSLADTIFGPSGTVEAEYLRIENSAGATICLSGADFRIQTSEAWPSLIPAPPVPPVH